MKRMKRNMFKLFKCSVASRHLTAVIKVTTFVPVFHLFTICGAVTLATRNTTTEAMVGEQVLFRVNPQVESWYEVTFSSKTPFTKIAVWKINNSVEPQSMHTLYEGRVQWNTSGSVVLYNAQISDSGVYEIEINYYDTQLKNTDVMIFELCVFEQVSQPAVRIIGDCPTPNVTLSCSVCKGTNVTFHWRKQSLTGAIDGTYNGTELMIDRGNEEEQHVYRCIAENLVSNATSDPVQPKLCNGNKDNLFWMMLLSLIPVSLFVWYSIIYTKAGRTTQEYNEQAIAFTNGFIEPTYTTRLN